jgi:hypothetical protein
MLVPELDVTALATSARFYAEMLELPCGRGVNFQLRVEDVDAVHLVPRENIGGGVDANRRRSAPASSCIASRSD